MLVLSRKCTESIHVGEDVVVTVLEIRGKTVRFGIDAPRDIPVHRAEVQEMISGPPSRPPPSVPDSPAETAQYPAAIGHSAKRICPQCESTQFDSESSCGCGHRFDAPGGPSTIEGAI